METLKLAMQVISTLCLIYIAAHLANGKVTVEGYVTIGNGQRSPVPVEVMKPVDVNVQR